jgi:RecA/RadA recombinase
MEPDCKAVLVFPNALAAFDPKRLEMLGLQRGQLPVFQPARN